MREYPQQLEAESAPSSPVPATSAEVLLEGHRATRDRVARSILDHGPSSAADLATRLGLTAAAVRRHLDGLAAAGWSSPASSGCTAAAPRRPAKVFALTECGRDAFYQAYDQLAAEALRWIAEAVGGGKAGEEAVAAFARARFGRQGQKYLSTLERASADRRTEALAEALSADGYAATVRRVPSAGQAAKAPAYAQLCQHHCPVAHIAEQFPQLCEAETEVFSQLLGTHVQRLATIAHGDGVCTTYVPAPGAAPSPAPGTGAAPTAGTTTEPPATSARRNPA